MQRGRGKGTDSSRMPLENGKARVVDKVKIADDENEDEEEEEQEMDDDSDGWEEVEEDEEGEEGEEDEEEEEDDDDGSDGWEEVEEDDEEEEDHEGEEEEEEEDHGEDEEEREEEQQPKENVKSSGIKSKKELREEKKRSKITFSETDLDMFKKLKAEVEESDSDSDEDDYEGPSYAIDPSVLAPSGQVHKATKIEKMKRILEGRTDVRFQHEGHGGGLTNQEKLRKKNFVMVRRGKRSVLLKTRAANSELRAKKNSQVRTPLLIDLFRKTYSFDFYFAERDLGKRQAKETKTLIGVCICIFLFCGEFLYSSSSVVVVFR